MSGDPWGFSPEARRGSQGASRAAPGKSCLMPQEREGDKQVPPSGKVRAGQGCLSGQTRTGAGVLTTHVSSRLSEPDPSHTLEERVVHWYFKLLDKNNSGALRSQGYCAVWRGLSRLLCIWWTVRGTHLELKQEPQCLARDGVSREVPCSALKGETVPDSLPATPKSPASSCLGRKPPRAPQLEETPETPPSSRAPLRPLRGLQETRVATREESGVLGFPSRRGLTPRGSLECNPPRANPRGRLRSPS